MSPSQEIYAFACRGILFFLHIYPLYLNIPLFPPISLLKVHTEGLKTW